MSGSEPECADNNANANAACIYAYMAKVHDGVSEERNRAADRANKLVVVLALIFAALSYGAGHLVLIAKNAARDDCMYWLSVIVGGLAGVALLVSFVAALKRSRIKTFCHPDTSGFAERLDDPAFLSSNHATILKAMSKNLCTAIKQNQKGQDKDAAWTTLLNWLPLAGFICTALFVGLTVAQSIVVPSVTADPPPCAQCPVYLPKEKTMPSEDEDKQKGEDQAGKSNENSKKDSDDEVLKDLVRPPREVRGTGGKKVVKRGERGGRK